MADVKGKAAPKSTRPDREIERLVEFLAQAYNRKSWHGVNLRGSLRLVDHKMALWKMKNLKHSIWELAVHATYWKYAVWRKITGAKIGLFPFKGSDWFAIEDVSPKAWKRDLHLLDDYHEKLVTAVGELRPSRLGKEWDNLEPKIIGVAYHDIYHAGQIQLLKKLYKKK
jgi:hypothetical protein